MPISAWNNRRRRFFAPNSTVMLKVWAGLDTALERKLLQHGLDQAQAGVIWSGWL